MGLLKRLFRVKEPELCYIVIDHRLCKDVELVAKLCDLSPDTVVATALKYGIRMMLAQDEEDDDEDDGEPWFT